jgi:hypothetical protein
VRNIEKRGQSNTPTDTIHDSPQLPQHGGKEIGGVRAACFPPHSHHTRIMATLEEVIQQIQQSKSHYETLGIPQSATQEDIKKSYYKRSKIIHPGIPTTPITHYKTYISLYCHAWRTKSKHSIRTF